MKRERLEFLRTAPTLYDLFFDASVAWRRMRMMPGLEHALECVYMAGALEAMGLALGYPGDDVRPRCMALQRQAADRLAELQGQRYGLVNLAPFRAVNGTLRRRARQHDKRFRD
jgi:hypothetical protein